MGLIVFLFIVAAIIFVYWRFIRSSYKFRFDAVTFFEGSLGSGKTTLLTYHAIKEYKRRRRQNVVIRIINFLFHWRKKKRKALRGLKIYSNYPIWISKKMGYSEVVNFSVLKWLYRVNEDCIIVLDEVAYMFPKEMKMTDERVRFCITWLRHATNCLLLSASQSLSECNITFRQKVCKVFHLTDCKCGPFFHLSHVNVREAIISEDMNNVYIDDKDHNQNLFRFRFPFKNFDSRYARLLYNLDDVYIDLLSTNFDLLLKAMGLKNGDHWNCLGYSFENYKERLKDDLLKFQSSPKLKTR